MCAYLTDSPLLHDVGPGCTAVREQALPSIWMESDPESKKEDG